MTESHIIRAIQNRPFAPFAVHLSSGESLEVRHPEFAHMFPGMRSMAIGIPVEEAVQIVDLLHVVSIAELPQRRGRRG